MREGRGNFSHCNSPNEAASNVLIPKFPLVIITFLVHSKKHIARFDRFVQVVYFFRLACLQTRCNANRKRCALFREKKASNFVDIVKYITSTRIILNLHFNFRFWNKNRDDTMCFTPMSWMKSHKLLSFRKKTKRTKESPTC